MQTINLFLTKFRLTLPRLGLALIALGVLVALSAPVAQAQGPGIPEAEYSYSYRKIDSSIDEETPENIAIVKKLTSPCIAPAGCPDVVYKFSFRSTGTTLFTFATGGNNPPIIVNGKVPPGPSKGTIDSVGPGGETTTEITITNTGLFAQTFPDAGEIVGSDDPAEEEIECEGGNLGWLYCDFIIKPAQDVVSFAKDFVVGYLKTTPLTQTGDQSNRDLFNGWKNMRTLANIFLIPVFFLIIFSQALSLNIEAYTVKKMLPRLLAAAILIQFSYFIVAILVDVTNVLGNGIGNLLTATFTSCEGAEAAATCSALEIDPGGFGNFLGIFSALTFVTVGLFNFGAALGLLATLMIPLLVSVLGVLLTLVFRQLMIVLLAIAAPLAFATWVLPNTEKAFRMWWSNLLKILMMYPMITMLFAAGTITAGLLTSGVGDQSAKFGGAIQDIMALVAVILPLAAVPFTFKFAGGAIAMVAEQANKYSRLVTHDSQGRRRGWYQRQVDDRTQKLKESMEGKGFFGNPLGAVGGAINREGTPAWVKRAPILKSLGHFRAGQVASYNARVTEGMKEIDDRKLKPETLAYMVTHGGQYDTPEGRKRFDELVEFLNNSDNPDHNTMAAELDSLRQYAGKDVYTAGFAKLAMAAGQTDLAMPESHVEALGLTPQLEDAVDDHGEKILDTDGNAVQVVAGAKEGATAVLEGLNNIYKGDSLVGRAQVGNAAYMGKDKHPEHLMTRRALDGRLSKASDEDRDKVGSTWGRIIGIQEKTLGEAMELETSREAIEGWVMKGLSAPEGSDEHNQALQEIAEMRYARNSTKKPKNKAIIEKMLNNISGQLLAEGKITEPIPVTTPVGGSVNPLVRNPGEPPYVPGKTNSPPPPPEDLPPNIMG